LREWHSYRAELDVLEARLRVSHPDLDWLEGLGRFKHQADAVLARRSRRPGRGVRTWSAITWLRSTRRRAQYHIRMAAV
jgi:hypothetical protein